MKKGFTLIEIIIVVALVLGLAAILIPVFSRGHEPDPAPPASICSSNLKQIALAVLQYQQNYGEEFSADTNSRHGLDKPLSWAGVLYPYLKSKQIFRCPSDETAKSQESSTYAYNAWLANRKAEDLENPSHTFLHFEVVADPNDWTQTGTGPQAVSASTRHSDGANYSFADGHVKWLKPTQVTAGKPDGQNYTFRIQ